MDSKKKPNAKDNLLFFVLGIQHLAFSSAFINLYPQLTLLFGTKIYGFSIGISIIPQAILLFYIRYICTHFELKKLIRFILILNLILVIGLISVSISINSFTHERIFNTFLGFTSVLAFVLFTVIGISITTLTLIILGNITAKYSSKLSQINATGQSCGSLLLSLITLLSTIIYGVNNYFSNIMISSVFIVVINILNVYVFHKLEHFCEKFDKGRNIKFDKQLFIAFLKNKVYFISYSGFIFVVYVNYPGVMMIQIAKSPKLKPFYVLILSSGFSLSEAIAKLMASNNCLLKFFTGKNLNIFALIGTIIGIIPVLIGLAANDLCDIPLFNNPSIASDGLIIFCYLIIGALMGFLQSYYIKHFVEVKTSKNNELDANISVFILMTAVYLATVLGSIVVLIVNMLLQ